MLQDLDIILANSFKHDEKDCDSKCFGWHDCRFWKNLETLEEAEKFIIKTMQRESYKKEIQCLSKGIPIPKDSTLKTLGPIIDNSGILRIGGRLNQIQLSKYEKNPVIIPGSHSLAAICVRHHHESLKHQGRHLTEGAIRAAGYWITSGKRLISLVIRNCVSCKKLRGKEAIQKMADIPKDRLEPNPPFTNVGVDVFGPWQVVSRKTRGESAS